MESSTIGGKNRISIVENFLTSTTMKRLGTPSIQIVLGRGMEIIWTTNLQSLISCRTIRPEMEKLALMMGMLQLRSKIHCLIGIHQRFMFINIMNLSTLSFKKTSLLGSIPITIRYIDLKELNTNSKLMIFQCQKRDPKIFKKNFLLKIHCRHLLQALWIQLYVSNWSVTWYIIK